MKIFITIALLAISLSAATSMAGGKISLQNNFYQDGKEYRPQLGLSITQKLFWKMSLTSWTGYGMIPEEYVEDTKWFTSKNQLDFNFNKVTVSPGYQYVEIINQKRNNSYAFLKLEYKLW